MHLAVITNFYPDRRQHAEYALHLVDGLRRARPQCRVSVLAGRTGSPLAEIDAAVTRPWTYGSPWLAGEICDAVRRLRPDAALVNGSFTTWGSRNIANMAGFLTVRRLSRFVRTGLLLHHLPHTMDTTRAGYRLNPLQWLGVHVACRLAASAHVTGFTLARDRDCFRARYKAHRTVHIEHGLLGPCGEAGWHERDGQPTVLAFGYWGPGKDLETLLRAVEATPNVHLIVAGTSHPRFPGFLEELQTRHPCPRIHWVGYVAETDTPSLFRAARLVVLPYLGSTGTSGVLHQAAQHGRAILASGLPVLREESERLGLRARYFFSESDLRDALGHLNAASLLEDGRHNVAVMRHHDMATVGELWWRALEGQTLPDASHDALLAEVSA